MAEIPGVALRVKIFHLFTLKAHVDITRRWGGSRVTPCKKAGEQNTILI